MLLALWIVGIYVFAAFVNWTINVRSILTLTPPAAILAAKVADRRAARENVTRWLLAGIAIAISVGVTAADYSEAGANQALAAVLQRRSGDAGARVWFMGPWGFQWYMEKFSRRVDNDSTVIQPGDWLVVYENTSNPSKLPMQALHVLGRMEARGMAGMSITDFYSDTYGPTPFLIGRSKGVPLLVLQATRPLRPQKHTRG